MLRRTLVLVAVMALSVGMLAGPAWAPPGETGCFGKHIDITGTSGNDTLIDPFGGNHAVVIDGEGGDDKIYGLGGSDTLCGGAGDDYLAGDENMGAGETAGGDQIQGGFGMDRVNGDAGPDFLLGGEDADNLRGGPGNDSLNGNGGNDNMYGEGDDDALKDDGSTKSDFGDGDGGTNTCTKSIETRQSCPLV